MDSEPRKLHIFFLPQMVDEIMIPTIEMARLFARTGVKVTIISTPLNAPFVYTKIERDRILGLEISVQVIIFPCKEAGLPEGCENLNSITSPEMAVNFKKAHILLRQPLEQLLQKRRPNCLVADTMFPWATEVAANLGIPRIVFYGTSFFFLCAFDCLRSYKPHRNVTSDLEQFTIPGLPDQIKLTRLQLPNFVRDASNNEIAKILDQALQEELKSDGVIVNSYDELEPDYSQHYTKVMGRKAWHIGPVSLSIRHAEHKEVTEETPSIDRQECLRWLNSKKPNSVLFVSFGNIFRFSADQLSEIAMGLEASGLHFIWVHTSNVKDNEEWMLEEFQERMEGKGLVTRECAQERQILEHEAVGGFLTHCEWSSILQSIAGGVPMVTWPLYGEQFFNEKLVMDILKIGVSVGAQEWSRWVDEKKFIVKKDDIAQAVTELMVGDEAEKMRDKAKVLGMQARRAVQYGGSSCSDLNALLEDLRSNCP